VVNNYEAFINPGDLLIYTRIEVVASQQAIEKSLDRPAPGLLINKKISASV